MSIEDFPKQDKPSAPPQETDDVGSQALLPGQLRFEGGKYIEKSREEIVAAPPSPEVPAIEQKRGPGDVVMMSPEQRQSSFGEYIAKRVQGARNFEELYDVLNGAEEVGVNMESSGVKFSAAELKASIQALVEKVRSGEEITEFDIETVTRDKGLRRRVEDLLKIEKVKLLLGEAA